MTVEICAKRLADRIPPQHTPQDQVICMNSQVQNEKQLRYTRGDRYYVIGSKRLLNKRRGTCRRMIDVQPFMWYNCARGRIQVPDLGSNITATELRRRGPSMRFYAHSTSRVDPNAVLRKTPFVLLRHTGSYRYLCDPYTMLPCSNGFHASKIRDT